MLVEESTIQFFGCPFYALHDCSYFTLKALYRQMLSKKINNHTQYNFIIKCIKITPFGTLI